MNDYKSTLNLPETDFPMKAGLPQREPAMLDQWRHMNLYTAIRKARHDAPLFLVHDGPPYANGSIHIGHALNKILKDMVVRSKTLSGFNAPFVPGWDCHGLPIEHKIETTHGKKIDAADTRRLCRAYAAEQVEIQKQDFIRLGILADWSNPYLTMDFRNEANEIRSLAKMVANGFVFQGLKPVNWCFDCASALAEAEVEYQDKKGCAVDVGFECLELSRIEHAFQIDLQNHAISKVSAIIWTTTPWTLPANQALNVHAEHRYALVNTARGCILLAEALVDNCLNRYALEGEILTTTLGSNLEKIAFQHPIYDRRSPIYLADYVALDAGTGIVHAAPAYGLDDFNVCRQNGLDNDQILTPVDARGVFNKELPFFGGLHIWAANDKIIEKLEVRHALYHQETIHHSYMHCWRHKSPLIYRAAAQWFIGMDIASQNSSMANLSLREMALQAIEGTNFIPQWGKVRLHNMIETRPDWCISRQRAWGVPIPIFIHKETAELHPNTQAIMEKVAQAVEKNGIDVWFNDEWFDSDVERLLGKDAADYIKVTDTLDVWFDSGTTHAHVLQGSHPMGHQPGPIADLYLEGSDQHRGWFQSSLLTGCAIDGQAPYKTLLTHGFTVDEKGHKMSKSMGNVVAPQEVTNTMGADILRLWVASTDYTAEMSMSMQILQRSADAYRRMRNTMRFMLGNLSGFDPQRHSIPLDQMIALDRWALSTTWQLQQEIIDDYEHYRFWQLYQKVHHFCIQAMGGFYLDIIKDRQYTTASNSLARRSCQTALYHIVHCFVRWIAPILSFTAEEVWQQLPGTQVPSVMLSTWYENPYGSFEDESFDKTSSNANSYNMDHGFWQKIQTVKTAVNKAMEELRDAKHLGGNLQAEVVIYADNHWYEPLAALKNELRFVLITSQAAVKHSHEAPQNCIATEYPGLKLSINKSQQPKCVRCWHHNASVGKSNLHPELCERCITNIEGSGEYRYYA